MKAKLLVAMISILALCSVATAQEYHIRTSGRNNLRAMPSLDGVFLETVPAGTVLHVVGKFGRWLKINRNGNEVWMADWLGYSRVEGSEPTASQPASNVPAQVDNCCFLDRQCNTNVDWENGYWAFQNGQCAAPSRTQPVATTPVTAPLDVDNCCQVNRQCHNDDDWARGYYDFQNNQCAAAPTTSTAPITGPIPEDVDNCCFVNWECHSEQDYVSGYERFKYNLCHVSPIEGGINLDGSGEFRGQVKGALQLLLDRAPKWYSYAISGLHVIRERPGRSASVTSQYGVMKVDPGRHSTYDLAAVIVHEACHSHRYSAGLNSGGYRGERDCTTKEVEVLHILAPGSHELQHEEWLLANMHKTSNQWWHD